MRRIRVVVFCLGFFISVATLLVAQGKPLAEVSGTYQFNHLRASADGQNESDNFPAGFDGNIFQSNTTRPINVSSASLVRLRASRSSKVTPRNSASRRGALPQASGLNFAPAVQYGTGGYTALSVAVADVNGDGKPDLLVANECGSSTCSNGSVDVLLGNGDGTFQPAVSYGSGGFSAHSVAVADVNGDGKPDAIVANFCVDNTSPCPGSSVGVLLGNGDGTFQPAVSYGSGVGYGASVAVADVNGDGKPDLVVANRCVGEFGCNDYPGMVAVLLGNGDGTFQTEISYRDTGGDGGDVFSAAVADVNGDGKPDLLVANECGSSNCNNGSVGVLLGNGDGTFQGAVSYGSGGYEAYSVAVADVNGDGKPDLMVTTECVSSSCGNSANGIVGVLLGNGDGTFQTAVSYDSGVYAAPSVAVADVNGDSKPDLLVANPCASSNCDNGAVGVLLGNGDGTFQTAVATPRRVRSAFGGGGGCERRWQARLDGNDRMWQRQLRRL